MTAPIFLPLEAPGFPANFLTAFLGGIAQLVERLVRNELRVFLLTYPQVLSHLQDVEK
jgi:hypothetical protein